MSKLSTIFFRIIFIVGCAGIGLPMVAQDKAPSTFEEAIHQANMLSSKTLSTNGLPGLAVGVSYDGVVVWLEGYGHANIEEEENVDPSHSLFRIGSVSKTLTSIALAQLVEGGQLDLDDVVQEYVPDFPEKRWPITSRQVAGHLAGIRHYWGMEFLNENHYPDVNSSLDIFKNDTLLFEPASKYSYSSYGWNLLSAVIEGSSGQPFLDYMDQKVFGLADMQNTYAELPDSHLDQKVQFYVTNTNGNLAVAPYVDNSYKWAGGGFISTALDLLKFSDAVFDHRIIESSTLESFTLSQSLADGKPTNYGVGWRIGEDKKGRRWVGHSGGSMGGSTMFMYFPDHKLTVVTLVNLSNARTNNLAARISEQFLQVIERPED